jgi:hypothetical protein
MSQRHHPRIGLVVALGAAAILLTACAGTPERDRERCREAGARPGSRELADCAAKLEAERQRGMRQMLNTIPIRGFGP